jgi:hypothetical protein
LGNPIENRIFHSVLFADDQIIFEQEERDVRYVIKKM